MDLSINISNADENLLKALRAVLKMRPELNFKIKKTQTKISPFEKEILSSLKEVEDAYKKGTLKTFDNVEDMHRSILNEN